MTQKKVAFHRRARAGRPMDIIAYYTRTYIEKCTDTQAKCTLRSSFEAPFYIFFPLGRPSSINHLFILFYFSVTQRQGLVAAHRHAGGRRRHTDDVPTMDLVVEDQQQQWSDDEYQPVVLKLEVHFAAPKQRKPFGQQQKKKNQLPRGGWNRTNISTGSSSGFIHLFLPLSMTSSADSAPLVVQTTSTTSRSVPAATAASVSGAEMMSTHRPSQTFKRVNNNKKKKKKKNKRKKKKNNNKIHQQQQIDESSNTMDSVGSDDVTASVVDQRYKPMQASHSNRLMPLLLHDDGIPPMLNSLSSDETQQWARWLRCTLCLKVMLN